MSAPITTKPGEAVPPAGDHAITFYFGKELECAEKFGANPFPIMATYKSMYPRMGPHRYTKVLLNAILSQFGAEGQSCILLPSLQSARECIEYAAAPERDDGLAKKPVPRDRMKIRAFAAKDLVFVVFFPAEHWMVVGGFWANAGVGVSSRFGEENSSPIDSLREVSLAALDGEGDGVGDGDTHRPLFYTEAHQSVKERIAHHLNRAPLTPPDYPRPTADDVYLFPSGMAASYKTTTYLSTQENNRGTHVVFGMAFANTVVLLGEVGTVKLLGRGTEDDLAELERFLAEQRVRGAPVQAIWTEFPGNPLLATPDIDRLRALADEHDTLLIIDDTIGSAANVDVLANADMVLTSLTKYFNGYADVIAGGVILNPASRRYPLLRALFDARHVPELYVGEARAMLRNSADYLARVATHNRSASALAAFLDSRAREPARGEPCPGSGSGSGSVVRRVFYPELLPSGATYRRFMRPATADFTPGFGCVLNIEFVSLDAARAFYDALNIHKGPHLGAPTTLVMPYSVAIYQAKLDWAAGHGMKPEQLRVAVGLEDVQYIIEEFRLAIDAANQAILGGSS